MSRFEITEVEQETFWRRRRRGGLFRRVPGSTKKIVRVGVLWSSRDGYVQLTVRRPTRAAAEKVARQTIGISEESWARMLARFKAREAGEKKKQALSEQKRVERVLKWRVRQGERAKKKLERLERSGP